MDQESEESPSEATNGTTESNAGDDAGLSDALAHLQTAAHEIAEAMKLFGSAAEKAVSDPEGAGAAIRKWADMGRAFVADFATTDEAESGGGGAGGTPSDAGEPPDDQTSSGK